MSEADMLAEFMDLMSREGISDKKLQKILARVERVLLEADQLLRRGDMECSAA